MVSSAGSSGIQIIDITDPSRPLPAASATDGADGFTGLHRASGVTVAEISGRTYALVASFGDGVQIIDITDPDLRQPGATIVHAISRDGAVTVAIDLDTTELLCDFAVTLSCGGDPASITGMDVGVANWQDHLAAFSEFDLTFVDGSRDDVPNVRIGFDAGGTIADATYPISFAGADLTVSGTVPNADAVLIRVSYETAAGGSCRVEN